MWNCLKRVFCLNSALVFAIFLARTGVSLAIVNGTLGHSVSLSPSIPVRQDVYEVVWKRSSPSIKIAKYLEGLIKYFNTSYNNRITLHSGNFSLEIHDLRKEDAGEYEVIVTAGDTGNEHRERMQLKVYALLSGAHITVQTTGICNLTLTCTTTSGDPTSFTWWRNGEALVNDSTQHIQVLGNTLEVHHTAEVEDIVYKCEARNPISNETAEIKLRDICKSDTSGVGDNFPKSISALIASINIVSVIAGLIFTLYFTLRRTTTGESVCRPTSQQLNSRRVLGSKEFGSNWQPLEENEMVRGDVLHQ